MTVQSITNVDTPYTRFTFGIPELGENPEVFNLPYVVFASNLRGEPETEKLDDVPFASLISDINTERNAGEILAPGYVFDLPTRGAAGRSFSVQTYPGFEEILEANPKALEDIEDEDIAFKFHIAGSATSLTRDEFVAQQTAEALSLRQAILADTEAPIGLIIAAADPDAWTMLYLAALEEAGLLRPEDEAPPVRQDPLVVSLMGVLATGILAGPAGQDRVPSEDTVLLPNLVLADRTDPASAQVTLVDLFARVRQWYGHDAELIGSNDPPPFEDFDLGTSRQTHFESFEILVPFGEARLDIPPSAPIAPVSFASLPEGEAAGEGGLATLVGPFAFGSDQFLPVGQPLPYTIYFENDSGAGGSANEIRVVTELDDDLDPRRFRLGDLKIGQIAVNLPESRGAFNGDFDFTDQLGFILRINAGLDIPTNTATWLIQAIDPDTGEVLQDPVRGLLPPNDAEGSGAGFVTYTTQPIPEVATGTTIDAQARVLLDIAPPQDTARLAQTVDALPPATALSVAPLAAGGSDFLLEWTATDDDGGSGVKHVTVYVAEEGGDFRILLAQSTETSLVFEGQPGRTYEFLALATDNAGNREAPPFGVAPPDDGSSPNLGSLPEILETSAPDLGEPPAPDPQPSTNPLFVEAQAQIPTSPPATRPSEFETVIRPFAGQSFATGIGESFADIGPMAILPMGDGSVLASGGLNRGSLYRFGIEGGQVGDPFITLPYPVFDLALAEDGSVWATTGGGPLLQLDADTGQIVQEVADSLTQTLAIEAETGAIYVSNGHGIEIFDPVTSRLTHFSDTRVGNMAFAPDGQLWAAVWPERGEVVRFDDRGRPELMLRLDSPVDSIAFGQPGTQLEDLLFVTNNSRPDGSGTGKVLGGELVMVDLATRQRVTIANDGSRGDIVKTTADGRVLLSQSRQIDVISPIIASRVAETNPPPDAIVALPRGVITVTFDQEMNAADPLSLGGIGSVLNTANFGLTADQGGNPRSVAIVSASYDAAGTYRDVTFFVSDGFAQSAASVDLLILPVNQPPELIRPADRTILEGETIVLDLIAADPENDPLTFSSIALPAFSTLDPNTGRFEWTPAFIQAGDYEVPFTVDDGEGSTTETMNITVLNVNAPPEFDLQDGFLAQEGQLLQFSFFAFDPDNPRFEPAVRDFVDETVQLSDIPPTVAYTFANLPPGAVTDEQTMLLEWTPDFDQAGDYRITFTATDDGDGTGRNGSAAFSGDGRTVIFTPSAGFDGTASFDLVADDGLNTSAPATVTVDVSNAPLLGIDLAERNPRLDAGETLRVAATGNFADQSDVPLPSSYVNFASTDPAVANVSPQGVATAVAGGNTVLVVSHGSIQAATAMAVGTPPASDVTNLLLNVVGLEVLPGAITLSSTGGTTRLRVGVEGELNLGENLPGTRYVVGNPDVVTVDADGTVTVVGQGRTEITIINGPAEVTVPVRVAGAQDGPVVIGSEGGVVRGTNGSEVAIAPDVLPEGTVVAIEPRTKADLPLGMPAPDTFTFAGAVRLEIGAQQLDQPVQLAVPVDPVLPAGAPVWFFTPGQLVDASGQFVDGYHQVAVGTVGEDGLARTLASPFPGIRGSGLVFAASADGLLPFGIPGHGHRGVERVGGHGSKWPGRVGHRRGDGGHFRRRCGGPGSRRSARCNLGWPVPGRWRGDRSGHGAQFCAPGNSRRCQ